jgi:very-short-patch-repair endonuclease
MKINDINWEEVQLFYNNDKNWSDVCKYFNISQNLIISAKKLGLFISRSKSESISISLRKTPRKHSEETKKKISEIRKKYLQENPDKVPYKLNHSSKESYPEKYFNGLFINENIKVERYYYIGLYELDFCIVDKKIDIEIDGEQHYVDERIEKSDINRNKFLENLGWTIIRIRWRDYQRQSSDDKRNYIVELKRKLVE